MKTLISGILFTALCGGGSVLAQQFPSKPVRLVVHLAAGGSTDIVARAMAQKLTGIWGQQVLVDNRPGGATVIGTEIVARSPPDGHTMLVAAAPFVINTLLMPKLPYELADFAPISLVNTTPLVLIVHPNVPVKSVQDLVRLAKSQPGKLNFGSASIGGAGHLAGELFNVMAGLKMTHVPYKGNTPALADLMGGHIDLLFNGLPSASPLVRSGRVRALGVTSRQRTELMPELPTISESGLKGFESVAWVGLLAPAKTPANVITKISQDVVNVVLSPEIKERLKAEGADPVGSTPGQYTKFLQEEAVKWAKVIKFARVKAE
jgi:tripartite-type tricarboxylate transporter receptor subunit TctC